MMAERDGGSALILVLGETIRKFTDDAFMPPLQGYFCCNYSEHPGESRIPALDSRLRGNDVFSNAFSEPVIPAKAGIQTIFSRMS
ncbi:hypothetical protein [Desulfonatronum thioautotrophicum]|uniref:hypothetical protein n=1 Tax=Desulfonatronum thioautotrophicum TaxID=617001 RepID=UPI0005EB2608|nr:hypothetical protein [Desulfonatronum thioautotrophicum]